tara:strand:+ start:300 stop:635 length:336 start_codon:yes stop_codon:yes gene_type:complete
MITAGHIDNDIGHVSLGNVPRNLSNSQVSSYKASIVEPVYRHTSDASVFMANRQTAPAAPAAGGNFNIDIRAPHLDILSRTGDAVGVIAYGTDTEDIYVFDGTHWQTYENS